MKNTRQTPVQNKIRNALLLEYRNIPMKEPVRISERALARKYNTTAITIHEVCDSLAQVEFLIHLPGKRGYFINPQWNTLLCKNLDLGILTRTRLEKEYPFAGISSRAFFQLSALCNAIEKNFSSAVFVQPRPTKQEDIVEEVSSLPFSCFLWFSPRGKDLEVFETLQKRAVPIMAFSALFDTDMWKAPSQNALIRDYYTMGALRACHLVKNQCTNPLYIGEDIPGKTFSGFCDAMKKLDLPFSQEQRFDLTNDLVQKVESFCRKFTPDSVIANGWIRLYYQELLQVCPKLRKIPFFVEGEILKYDPPGPKNIVRTMDFNRLYLKIGKKAAHILQKIVQGEILAFDNILLTEEEYDASGLKKSEYKIIESICERK